MEPTVIVFVQLAVILVAAKLGGELCERMRQPAVLGELLAGVVLGNLVLAIPAWTFFQPLRAVDAPHNGGVQIIAELGVVLLLFETGLETTVAEMRRVGVPSVIVAVVGVCLPFALGYGASALLIHTVPDVLRARVPDFPLAYVHLFIGATLAATSVGITARVFKDLGVMHSLEARIVLGAAVIDDVIGLVLLAIVNGLVVNAQTGASLVWTSVLWLALTAVVFLAGALIVGTIVVPRVVNVVARFRSRGVMVAAALAVCFAFSAGAGAVGLAPIVGAFAAGLILEEIHFAGFPGKRSVREVVAPIVDFVAPVFFVVVGMQVHLEYFLDAELLLIGGILTVAAVAGKIACGYVVPGRGLRRNIIGLGMIPRGEVGLIFAGIGRAAGVIDDRVFAAVIVVVVVTTIMTPVLLGRALRVASVAE